jgi:hypothetical protein
LEEKPITLYSGSVKPLRVLHHRWRVQRVLKEAAGGAPARVAFGGGVHRLDPGKAAALIDLDGARDLVIDGGGASIVFTAKTSFARLKDCSNIHIKGFTVDYDPLPHTAGKVVALDRRSRSVDIEVLPGFPLLEDDESIARTEDGMVRTPDDFAMKNAQPLVVHTKPTFERPGGRRYRLRAKGAADFDAFAVGDVYVKGPRGPPGFAIEGSSDVAVTDLTMHMCTGIGFATRGAERLRIINVRLERKAGRPIAVQNGGHNHHDARTGPWVEGCLFEHTGDDICHVSCLVIGVKEKRSATELVLWGTRPLEPGDKLQFYDRERGRIVSERRVVSAKASRRTSAVMLDGDVGPILADPLHGGRKEYAGTQVFNANAQCNQFVWRGNTCRRGRRVGVLCKGRGGLIEGNLFQQQGGGAVEIWNAPYEGLYADGYVIRGNRMLECGLVGCRGDSRTFWVFNRFGSEQIHRNILFEDNEIRDYPCRAMIVRDARDVVIRGNRMTNERFAEFRHDEGVVDIENCSGVTFKGNPIRDRRATPGGPVRIRDCAEVER